MPAVYDDEKEKLGAKTDHDGTHDSSGAHPKHQETNTRDTGDLQKAESTPESTSGGRAEDREKDKLDDQVGLGYTGDDKSSKKSLRKKAQTRFLTTKRLLGFGAGGGIVTVAIVAFLSFMPALRLESYMSRINERAFAIAMSAVEKRMGYLLERYLVRHAINLDTCRRNGVRNNDCRMPRSRGIVGNLYEAWQDVRIEQKLFDRYGIEVESDSRTGRYTITDRFGRQIQVSGDGTRSGRTDAGSRALGRDLRHFMKSETRWHQVLERRSVRKYLRAKHGIRMWCLFACKTRDSIEIRKQNIKTRIQLQMTKRFVYPFSSKLGVIIDCVTSSGSKDICSPSGLRERGIDRQPNAEFINDLAADINNPETPNRTVGQRVVEKIVDKIFENSAKQVSGRAVAGAIPVVGWVYFGVSVVDMIERVDEGLKNYTLSHIAADVNLRQYIEFYSGMRSFNDEMKSGKATLEEVGAMASEFNGAEQSLIYQSNYNPEGKEVYRDQSYKCPSGRPIPDDKLVCPEKTLQRTFWIEDLRNTPLVDTLRTWTNMYDSCGLPPLGIPGIPFMKNSDGNCTRPTMKPKEIIRPGLETVDSIIGFLSKPFIDALMSGLRLIPGFNATMEFIAGVFQQLFNHVFPLPVNVDSPGRDKYDALEAGGSMTANEYAKGGYTEDGEKYGLGAPVISDEDAELVFQEYMEQRKHEYSQQSLVAKLTDLSYSDSFANKFIDSTPSDYRQIPRHIAMSIPQIFTSLAKLIMGVKPVFAQAATQQTLVDNAFGVTRYGYPANHPAFSEDPDKYTDEFCQGTKSTREDSLIPDVPGTDPRDPPDNMTATVPYGDDSVDRSGFDDYSVADPCLLEEAVVEAGSSFFIDEEEGIEGGGGGLDQESDGGSLPSGSAQQNAQRILDSSNVDGDSRYMAQIRAIAGGDNSCQVNPTVLSLIVAISQRHSIYISSLNRQCTGVLTASGTSSYHWRDGGGHALDISRIDGARATGATANDLSVINHIRSMLPAGSGIGQSNCRSRPLNISGVREFSDTCNHLHIEVPVR